MARTRPEKLDFDQVIAQIAEGRIQIPQFQREFVWTKDKSAALLDSIIKGYPIGTFILWETREQLRAVRSVGGLELGMVADGHMSKQVLDGQQRLTSLFASIKGAKVTRNGRVEDFSTITVDLLADPNSDDAVILMEPPSDREASTWIRLRDLVNVRVTQIAKYPERFHETLEEYRNTVNRYEFSVVTVSDAPIEVATEIFTRLNVGGQKLSTFEIMVAKTYDPGRDFDLAVKYDALIATLDEVNYGTIPSAVVLQTVGALQEGVIKSRDLLALDKQGFIDTWPHAVSAIEAAVDYFRNYFRVPVSKLLPYPHLLVPFAYFFSKHPDPPEDEKRALLQDFFWRVSIGTWYSRSTEARLEADLKKIDRILEGKQPRYEQGIDVTPEAIDRDGWFRAGRAWVKAVLCLYAAQRPLSFADGRDVVISNDWLKQANSRNYHHFFPRAWMRKNRPDDWRENHIANITIVDDFLNKRRIRSRAPSDYMKEFQANNDDLVATMATHLIHPDRDGVYDDDFDQFFKKRCRRISKQLRKRIISIEADRHAATPEANEEQEG